MLNRKFTFSLAGVVLLAFAARGAGPALAAPAQQEATPIAYGATVTGSLDSATPEARYQFTAQEGDVVTISLKTASGDLDPKLQLLGPDGAVVAENDDHDFPTDTNALIENFTILTAGDYIIVAMRGLGSTSGGYTLSLAAGGGGSEGGPSMPGLPTLPTLDTGAEGAAALRFVLAWGGPADLDLSIWEPGGALVYAAEPTTPDGGALDASRGNDYCATSDAQPREVVFWAESAPAGDYAMIVDLFDACGGEESAAFTLTVEAGEQALATYEGVVPAGKELWRDFYTYTGVPAEVEPVTSTGQGALRFVLTWSGTADVDLAVTDPSGNFIDRNAPSSPTGGALDSTQGNDACGMVSPQPQEIIAWQGGAPAGDYIASVRRVSACSTLGQVSFTLTVEADGQVVATYQDIAPSDTAWQIAFVYGGGQ